MVLSNIEEGRPNREDAINSGGKRAGPGKHRETPAVPAPDCWLLEFWSTDQ